MKGGLRKMVFKLVKKQNRSNFLNDHMRVNRGNFVFGSDYKKYFDGFTHAEIYLDREDNLVGFKATNDNVKGYKINFDKITNRVTLTSKITYLLPEGAYEPKIDTMNDMLVIQVKEIAEKITTKK